MTQRGWSSLRATRKQYLPVWWLCTPREKGENQVLPDGRLQQDRGEGGQEGHSPAGGYVVHQGLGGGLK